MSVVSVCEGVQWEAVPRLEGTSAFCEAGLEAIGHPDLVQAVKQGDYAVIESLKGEQIGSGQSGAVFTCKGAPDIAIKLHYEPFSATVTNRALQAGLALVDAELDIDTPAYHAFIQGTYQPTYRPFPEAATVMSLVSGHSLRDQLGLGEELAFPCTPYWNQLYVLGHDALQAVGINSGAAFWDISMTNLMSANGATTLEGAFADTVTWIDLPSVEWAQAHRNHWQQ